MLPHHLQTVGGRCIARARHSRPLHMSGNYLRFPWWTGYYPSSYFPVSGWYPQDNSRPYHYLLPHRPSLPGSHTSSWFPAPSSWLHISPLNMAAKGDEPFRKRKKSPEEDEYRHTPWTKRPPYPPAADLRVPPIHGSPEAFVAAGTQAETKAEVKRRWEDFSHHYQQRCANETFDFTVMSYNILSQDLLEDNSGLYAHCRRPCLFWNYRLPNILRELQDMNADILCLQEVQEDHYEEQMKPGLQALGYVCVYKSRTGSKPDGCAICFKADKFTLKLVKPVEYFRKHIALLDRDNIGLVLMLQPKTGGRDVPTICVANTHLLYNPRRGDIKLTQLAILLAEITEVAQVQDARFCPIVLCGDFNSVPGSPLHRFIKEGTLHYEGMTIGKVSGQEQTHRGQRVLSIPIWPRSLGINQKCVYESPHRKHPESTLKEETQERPEERTEEPDIRVESSLRHHFQLSSVYSHYVPDTGMPEITTCHSKSAITVDYIFYSAANDNLFRQPGSDAPCNRLQLLGRLSLLTEQDLWSVNGLPNETNSSDHLSLMAKFRLAL